MEHVQCSHSPVRNLGGLPKLGGRLQEQFKDEEATWIGFQSVWNIHEHTKHLVLASGFQKDCTSTLPYANVSHTKARCVWHTLRSLGLKQQITWEDAVEEANHIQETGDHGLSRLLFQHVEKFHQTMEGNEIQCLESLRQVKWILAHPAQDGEDGATSCPHLASLSEVFPASELDLVWAVASTLHRELPEPNFLRAMRSTRQEPKVLVSQLERCAQMAPQVEFLAAYMILFMCASLQCGCTFVRVVTEEDSSGPIINGFVY